MNRRIWIIVTDQAVSSAGNFLVVLAVARVSGVAEFGAFSLAFIVCQITLGLMRAGAGDVLLIRSTAVDPAHCEDPRHALSFVLAFSTVAAAAVAGAGALIGGAVSEALVVIAIVLVPVVLEDCYRYTFFFRSSPRDAVVIDGVWLLAQLTGFSLAGIGLLPETPAVLVLIWGAGAGLACLCGAIRARVFPGLNGVTWIRVARHRVGSLMADFTLLTGFSYIGFLLVPLVANLSVVAALRGALLLFNPFLALLTSVRVVALPMLTKRLPGGPSVYRRIVMRFSAALFALATVYASVVLLLPDSVGTQLLGQSWDSARAILVPISLAYLAGAIGYPAIEGLRALGSAQRLIITRTAATTAAVICLIAGTASYGAIGGAIGLCAAYWGAALLWHMSLRTALAIRRDGAQAWPEPLSDHGAVDEELSVLDSERLA